MRSRVQSIAERGRITSGLYASKKNSGPNGAFQVGTLRIISGNGWGWDHVSVSLERRCPTWDEMELVRGWFFEDGETVIQFSPPRGTGERVNYHPHCLHLWRQHAAAPELPPSILVGPRTEGVAAGMREGGKANG